MKTLIVAGEAGLRHELMRTLEQRGFAVTAESTAAAGHAARRRSTFDVVVVAAKLTDGSGLDIIEQLRRTGSRAHIIVLGSDSVGTDRLRAFEQGADDYMVAPIFVRELVARVMSVHRRTVPGEGSRLRTEHLQIDLVGRRVLNDDRPLVLTTKEFDLLAFLATRPGVVVTREQLLCEVWNSDAEWQQMATVTEHVRRLRAKIEIDPTEPRMLTTVRGAGYRWDSWPTKVGTASTALQIMAEDLRRGLDNDEFVVHYQPVVSLTDRQLVATEALVRWRHPQRGLLTPSAFMETAERTGMIVELGALVVERACRQTAEWRRAGRDVELAVNVSGVELSDPMVVERIARALADSGLEPTRLWVEVTETMLVEDLHQVGERLHDLARMGARISIDDFGTGWASLLYLRHFPVHGLKIDGVFVSGTQRSPNDTAIARTVLALGVELDLAVVAEGVETREQEHALAQLGCAYGQGFLYGRPTSADLVPIHTAARCEPGRTASALIRGLCSSVQTTSPIDWVLTDDALRVRDPVST